MFEPNWGEYWVDNDSDGYNGWDGIGDDCNDDDWSINPGYNVWVSCDYVNAGDDNNCSGVDDIYECQPSPIIIDVVGDGFRLTDASNGVVFDLPGQGAPGQLPWTAVGSDDAWLALDRNGNGRIDNGLEMFGNFTEQPPSNERNGFRALAIFDEPANGGNGDRWIDSHDSVYAQLQLWVDRNHDGVSQASELENLPATHLRRISLDYRDLRRVDRFGNWFRYGARVLDDRNRDIGPMAYDVFLGSAPPPLPGPRGAGRER